MEIAVYILALFATVLAQEGDIEQPKPDCQGKKCAKYAEALDIIKDFKTKPFTFENGEQGPMGEVGPQGDEGGRGQSGRPGDEGPQGGTGGKGMVGPDGANGLQGRGGVTGDSGVSGEVGAIGEKGKIGANGDRGVRGQKGENAIDTLSNTLKGLKSRLNDLENKANQL